MDVKILGVAVTRFFNKFYEDFRTHPLDIDKTTIASYAGYIFQEYLMKNKRIGQFTPNLLPLYGAMKNAAIGGITMVLRTSNDGNNEFEQPINSHLYPDNKIKGKGTAIFDVNSLYPAATLKDLPYGVCYFSTKSPRGNFLINGFDRYADKLMDSDESQVVQYLANVTPSCERVYSSFHAGPGQLVFGRTLRRLTDMTILHSPGEITVIQYHDKSHYKSHSKHASFCQYYSGFNELEYNEETKVADDENNRYAAYLSKNLKNIKVKYKTYNECNFFHPNCYQYDGKKFYKNPKEYLLNNGYSENTIFKPQWLKRPTIDCNFLMEKILKTNECDSSFVVIKKGAYEDSNDNISDMFGFCLQRNSPSIDDLGPHAFELAKSTISRDMVKKDGENEKEFEQRVEKATKSYLNRRLNFGAITYTRKSFQSDQCLLVSYLKMLIELRNLKNIEILHYIHMEGRNWHYPFIYNLLQSRHLLGPVFSKLLQGTNLKLTANSLYGQFMMEKSRYHKYTYALDDHLKKKPPLTVSNINLLSAVRNKKTKKLNLLYHLKYPQTNAKISNLMHVGATILHHSRIIFFQHVFNLLKYFDERKSQLSYMDTDSAMLFVSSENLQECIKPQYTSQIKEIWAKLFSDPNATNTQAGLLKLEGYFQSAFFKCVKSYVLNPFPNDTDSQRVVKSKGLAKVIRENIPDKCFKVGIKRKNEEEMFFQHYSLHPTMAEEIYISLKRKRMANAINCKRQMTEVNYI